MWGTGKNSTTVAPFSVSAPTPVQFHRQTGRPRHKEWGLGCRFAGSSVIGVWGTGSLSASAFFPNIASVSGGRTYDLYSQYVATAPYCFSLHPYFINRLNIESRNWGRYAFRRIGIQVRSFGPTNTSGGWMAAISRDVSLPFSESWTSGISDVEILSQERSTNGSWWQGFGLAADDYRGDRTWPCNLPTADAGEDIGATVYANLAEEFYQYFFTASATETNAGTGVTYGYVYVNYEIDFYVPRYINNNLMSALDYNPTLASTTTTTSGSLTSQEPAVVSRTYRQALDTKKVPSISIETHPMMAIGRKLPTVPSGLAPKELKDKPSKACVEDFPRATPVSRESFSYTRKELPRDEVVMLGRPSKEVGT
jgi:hypothetical protein